MTKRAVSRFKCNKAEFIGPVGFEVKGAGGEEQFCYPKGRQGWVHPFLNCPQSDLLTENRQPFCLFDKQISLSLRFPTSSPPVKAGNPGWMGRFVSTWLLMS